MGVPDLSRVPEADLKALAAGNMAQVSEPTLRYLAGEPPQEVKLGPNPSVAGIAAQTAVNDLEGAAGTAATGILNIPHYAIAGVDNALQHIAGVQHPKSTDLLEVGSTPSERQFQHDLAASPLVQNPVSQAVIGKIAELRAAHPELADFLSDALGISGATAALRSMGPSIGAIAGNVADRAAAERAAQATIDPLVGRRPVTEADAGLRNQMGHPVATVLAGKSGQEALKLQNTALGNYIAGRDIGVTGPLFEPGVAADQTPFELAKVAPNSVYRRAATALGPSLTPATDPQFVADVSRALTTNPLLTTADTAESNLIKQMTRLADPNVNASGDEIVNALGALRQRGFKNAAADPEETQQLGMGQLRLADAVENYIGRHLPAGGDVDLPQLQAARVALAKIHSVEGAMRGANVDPRVLARFDAANPGVLTGGLKTLADFAAGNPSVVGLPNEVAYAPPSYGADLVGLPRAYLGDMQNLLSPRFWLGLTGVENQARRALTGRAADAFALADRQIPLRDDAVFAPREAPPGPSFGGLLTGPSMVNAGGGATTPSVLEELGLSPDVQAAGAAHPGAPRAVGTSPSPLADELLAGRPMGTVEPPPFGTSPPHSEFYPPGQITMGAMAAPAGAPGGISLADVLSTGIEQPRSEGLSLSPMGAPAGNGLPFGVPPELLAGDLSLAPEGGAAAGAPMPLGDLAAVASQGVPEGIVAGRPPALRPPRRPR
ncbi:MAG: hypothetical protein KGL39_09740 [Patescibacteria group bacterium]|nr:hypothetical protein [Patescibacteria group bacterium]